jgi:hypothetical protein
MATMLRRALTEKKAAVEHMHSSADAHRESAQHA